MTVAEAATVLRAHGPPRVGIVLGSGLGAVADAVQDAVSVAYDELPGFPRPTVHGHAGRAVLGRLRGGLDEERRRELLERFELDPTKKGRSYSKGNRQKVALVAALASDVELLVLDEPTSGLDPIMESVFQEYVERFRDGGGSVLLSVLWNHCWPSM